MCETTISIPDQLLPALGVPAERAGTELRMLAAVKLFELKRLSSGAAASLAGIPRVVFLQRLAEYGVVTFDLTEDELREEIRNA